MLQHKIATMLHRYLHYNLCIKYYLQVNMDSNDNEFNSLNCHVEVIDSASDQSDVTEDKRKRSILLMEYLCKTRKRHAIQKEKKKLSQEESYAG